MSLAVGGADTRWRGIALQPRNYPELWARRLGSPWRQTLFAVWMLAAAATPVLIYLASVIVFALVANTVDRLNGFEQTPGTFRLTPALFLANNLALAALIPVTMLIGALVSGQRPGFLSSVAGRIRWRWLLTLLCLVAPLWVLPQLILAAGGGYSGLHTTSATPFMIGAVLLTTPLQAAGEEYAFRGFITRAARAILPATRLPLARFAAGLFAAVVSSLVFMRMHSAADPWLNTFYFCFGLIASYLAWRTGGLEAPIVMHAVNNVVEEASLPFTDFSHLFDRAVGTGSPALVIFQLGLMLTAVGLVELAMRVGPVRPRRTYLPGPLAAPRDDVTPRGVPGYSG